MLTRSPFWMDSHVSLAVSGSTPMICMPGKSVRATVPHPAIRPPPPTGATSASSDGTSCSNSRAAVPCPAMIASSSNGGTTTRPVSDAIRRAIASRSSVWRSYTTISAPYPRVAWTFSSGASLGMQTTAVVPTRRAARATP